MKKTILSVCVVTSLSMSLPLVAGDQDPVAASFVRMLDKPARISSPSPLTQLEHDPLYRYLTMVLWDIQPAQCTFSRSRDQSLELAKVL